MPLNGTRSEATSMWAYADETGNTGTRIRSGTAIFITAAMVTKANFDLVRGHEIAAIARKAGVNALHANDSASAAGTHPCRSPASGKKADARFLPPRKALPRRLQGGGYLILMLGRTSPCRGRRTLKAATPHAGFQDGDLVSTGDRADRLGSVTTSNEGKSRSAFLRAAKSMLARVPNVPDERSRQIF